MDDLNVEAVARKAMLGGAAQANPSQLSHQLLIFQSQCRRLGACSAPGARGIDIGAHARSDRTKAAHATDNNARCRAAHRSNFHRLSRFKP